MRLFDNRGPKPDAVPLTEVEKLSLAQRGKLQAETNLNISIVALLLATGFKFPPALVWLVSVAVLAALFVWAKRNILFHSQLRNFK